MDDHFQQSLRLWPLLVLAARNRQTLTFGMVEKMTGIGDHFDQSKPLENIYYYCKYKNLPHLNFLVVHEHTGKPGAEWYEGLDIPQQHADIFDLEWDKWKDNVPSYEALQEARLRGDAENDAA